MQNKCKIVANINHHNHLNRHNHHSHHNHDDNHQSVGQMQNGSRQELLADDLPTLMSGHGLQLWYLDDHEYVDDLDYH